MFPETPYNAGMATDKAKLMIYLPPAYKEGLAKLAALENRSMSNYVETLIIDTVEQAVDEGKIPQVRQPLDPAQQPTSSK